MAARGRESSVSSSLSLRLLGQGSLSRPSGLTGVLRAHSVPNGLVPSERAQCLPCPPCVFRDQRAVPAPSAPRATLPGMWRPRGAAPSGRTRVRRQEHADEHGLCGWQKEPTSQQGRAGLDGHRATLLSSLSPWQALFQRETRALPGSEESRRSRARSPTWRRGHDPPKKS